MSVPRTLFNLACLAWVMVLATVASPAHAYADDKGRVKAAMVYNIMRFTTFPGSAGRLRLCSMVDDPVASDLRALDGRAVGGARIDVMLVSDVDALGTTCNVIYVDNVPARAVTGRARGQLLIGGGRNFAEGGGTVGLISFGSQIRFVINDAAAKRAGVSFSAQLLQLAAKVIS